MATPRMRDKKYNLVAENPQSTVVVEYVSETTRAGHYQGEATNSIWWT